METEDTKKTEPCVGLRNLARANDYHLLVALACFRLVKEKLQVSNEEIGKYIKDASRDIGQIKFALLGNVPEKTDVVDKALAKIVKFDA